MILPIQQPQSMKDGDSLGLDSRARQRPGSMVGEGEFICSKQFARQFINNLIREPETSNRDNEPFYLFSGEKRRVRVTILPR
jgi:hypothetical protein